MGKCKMEMPKELMELLARMDDVEEIGKEALTAAEPIVEKALKEECAKHHKSERDPTRGELVDSIKPTGAKKNKNGLYDFIRPTGKDSKGVRNMEKLAYMNYGTSKQPATPITQPVINRIDAQVREKIQSEFEKGAGL